MRPLLKYLRELKQLVVSRAFEHCNYQVDLTGVVGMMMWTKRHRNLNEKA